MSRDQGGIGPAWKRWRNDGSVSVVRFLIRLTFGYARVIEQEIESAIDARNEALPTLRELGPPDLVHLVKQSVKSGSRQVCILRAFPHSSGTNPYVKDWRLPPCNRN